MSQLIEVYQSSVQTWECDQMGHMNVRFYLAKATTGLNSLAVHLGLGPSWQRQHEARLVADDHHIRFLREQRDGAPIAIRAGVLETARNGLKVFAEMTNAASGEVAATFVTNVCLRSPLGMQQPLPESVMAAARDLQVGLPGYAAPRGIEMSAPRPNPTLAEAESLGMRRTGQGEVLPGMCDRFGQLAAGACMGIVSDTYPNVFALASKARLEDDYGGAAVEYRFVYRNRPREGDVFTLRSAVKSVSEKTYSFCHWLLDTESGRALATAEVVALPLDLKSRRAVPVPDKIREGLSQLLVPEVSV